MTVWLIRHSKIETDSKPGIYNIIKGKVFIYRWYAPIQQPAVERDHRMPAKAIQDCDLFFSSPEYTYVVENVIQRVKPKLEVLYS